MLGWKNLLSSMSPSSTEAVFYWVKWERRRNPFGVVCLVKDSTLKKDYAHLKGFFGYLVATGVLLKDPCAFLKLTLTVRKGKGSKLHVLPLMPGVLDRLQQLLRQRWRETQSLRRDIPLLATCTGQRPRTGRYLRLSQQGVSRILQKHAAQAQVPGKVTALTLRHCFATHLVLNGVGVCELAEFAGMTPSENKPQRRKGSWGPWRLRG